MSAKGSKEFKFWIVDIKGWLTCLDVFFLRWLMIKVFDFLPDLSRMRHVVRCEPECREESTRFRNRKGMSSPPIISLFTIY